jgi:hypothetical protein
MWLHILRRGEGRGGDGSRWATKAGEPKGQTDHAASFRRAGFVERGDQPAAVADHGDRYVNGHNIFRRRLPDQPLQLLEVFDFFD